MADYAIEFGLTMLIFLLALGVALALILFGVLLTLWGVSRGSVQTQSIPAGHPATAESFRPTTEAEDDRGVVALRPERARHTR